MLVVISLIALLISMLLPALQKSKGRARMTQCLANTRSQATAFIAWADFHGGLFPTCDQTTYWHLDALYVLDKNIGYELSSYGLATNPKDGSVAAETITTAWHCPSLASTPRLYIANHPTGVCHVDQYMIQTGLEAQGKHPWSRLNKATPKRVSDSVGVVSADQVQVTSGVFTTNHMAGTQVEGFNQGYSDGHAKFITGRDAERPSPTAPPYAKWDSGWPWYWSWVE